MNLHWELSQCDKTNVESGEKRSLPTPAYPEGLLKVLEHDADGDEGEEDEVEDVPDVGQVRAHLAAEAAHVLTAQLDKG